MKKLQIIKSLERGFTLIELLIVIAVLGVLAAVVVSAIDPIDKINAGNDAKVIQDISVIGNALESYAVSNNGTYPPDGSLSLLVGNGDLKAIPIPPTGYTCTNYTYDNTSTATTNSFTLSCTLKAKKVLNMVRKYESSTGKACTVASVTTACPTTN